ncbi:YopX family protein [Bacillus thuringiensis]|uniref:YopX family protein n=1 Tax=Bacillus thuringiensis TaxID=1428 RepID=UPI0011A91565|nr:YopX family protein [Bacillus thuringiensis]
MKEPKFRGYSKDTNQWHFGFGYYINNYTETFKVENGIDDNITLFTESSPLIVEMESVGQYATTLTDVNNIPQELFAGDIIRFRYKGEWNPWSNPMMIEWGGDEYPAFDVKGHTYDCNLLSLFVKSNEYEIEYLGTVYENPELLISHK